MPRINIGGFANIKTEFPQVPVGWYKCRITGGELQLSKKAEKAGETEPNMINWEFSILEGDNAGQNLWLYTMIRGDKENSAWMTKKVVECANVAFDDDGFDLDACRGAELMVQVVADTYEGKETTKAKDVKALES